ncbi:unnamed protein product [Trichobilharzia szidati]|nr:unnamed protein product [Trichobilharzia szidati]
MDAPTQAILSAFSVVLGIENGDRQAAEQNLTALEVLEVYPVKVMNIFSDEQLSLELRQLAGITLKNYVTSHWSEASCLSFKPPETTDEAKSYIRSGILQLLTSPHRRIRATVARTITIIAQHDWPEVWPDLFNQLIELIRQSSMSNDMNVNKNTVHGVIRVLTEISSDLSDLDLPIVGAYLMPELLKIYSDKEHYGESTRRRAIITIDNLLNIALMCHNEDLLNAFVDRYIRPSFGAIVNDLTSEESLGVSKASIKSELIQLLTTLCVENPKFFSTFPGYNMSQMINVVLHLVVYCVKHYVELKITTRDNNCEVEDEYDSDGDLLDYDAFVYSVLECLTSLISSKPKKSVIKYLDDLCFQVCQLVQLPEKTLETWTNNISDYVNDSEEHLGYSVRLVTMDLIKTIASNIHNGTEFINHSVRRMLTLSENLHNNSVSHWWKPLEASLCICGNLASVSINIFDCSAFKNTSSKAGVLDFNVFYTHYLKPSLEQKDFPFLQATALRCMSHLYEDNILNESQAQCLPSLLANSMLNTQSSILRISAMNSLDVLRTFKGKKLPTLNTTSSSSPSTTEAATLWIQNYIVPQLPNLISNLLECLSTFGEPVLDIGLSGLYDLLCIDLHQFTQSIIGQIIPIMVGLFKHCFGVSGTLSYYTNIIRIVYKASCSNKESLEMIENTFMPTLIGCLENQETSDCCSVEAALKVFCVLIHPSEFQISPVLMQRVFPAVVHTAITSTDSVVISECCDVIRCYLAASPEQILEWHDDEGNNGVGYILHITSRLLDPSNPVEWAIPAGKLAYAILLRFNAQQLRENTDLLLRGVLARLCTLMKNNHKSASQSYNDQETGVHGAKQSLLFVLILLFRVQTKLAIDFLSTIPDLTGKPILQEILYLWCNCQPFYFSRYEIQVSTMALANLILYSINSKDERIMQITIHEELPTNNDTMDDVGTIQTRAKTSQQAKTAIQIPIIVSMYKLLLSELNKKLEEEECENEFDDDDDDDEEGEEEEAEADGGEDDVDCIDNDADEMIMNKNKVENGLEQQQQQGDEKNMNGQGDQDLGKKKGKRQNNMQQDNCDNISDIDDEDEIVVSEDPIYSTDSIMTLNLKEYLCNFLSELSQQVYYNEFSRYHTPMELATLQQIGVLPSTTGAYN